MRFTRSEKTAAIIGGSLAAALIAAIMLTRPAAASAPAVIPTISTYKNWTITIGQDPTNAGQWTFMAVGPNGGAVAPGTLFPSAAQAYAGAQNAVDSYIANGVQA